VRGEAIPELRAEGGFADAAFARQDEDLVLDAREALRDEWDVGVRAFGGGGADGLVGAAGAGVGFAGLLGLGAGAVLWYGELVWMLRSGGEGGGLADLALARRVWGRL